LTGKNAKTSIAIKYRFTTVEKLTAAAVPAALLLLLRHCNIAILK
jgi:hypothetical protein